ncbi:hypothetical protein CCAX7_16250 [Capsulimonas corticalis]|uniref:Uncharacterized protein n=1 Tax=Capsulimonas corticalis TaxID=2219043 RepID=A0A402CZ29_9BACT|nr:DUF1003 domain-containing protein [Capsulimonas corticalis]BDI29574.1 hypothetical protein CCAX7_16250 [Capsulimonas corticalis]
MPVSQNSTSAAQTADPISQNIDAVVAMHALAEQQVDPHQRGVESLTSWLGRPQFFYGILVGVSVWMIFNTFAFRLGLRERDEPPFFWLQGIVGLCALLMTTVVLITQNRQGKLAERREQLDLQMSLLTEQRTAKIIDLLEELRRDMPTVHNRVDLEAQALIKTVDPQEVLAALEIKLEETMETTAAAQIVTDEIDEAAIETEQRVIQAKQEKGE